MVVADALARIDSVLEAEPMQVQAVPQHPQGASVTLQDVHFSYDGKTEVIKGVSLEIQPGQTVAFVGPSGGGKTTVSRLAARFWDYQKGHITVGGMEVSKIDPEKLMSLYSIVFQDVTLFETTRSWKTSVWGAKAPPMRRFWRQQSWQTARNLPKSCRTSGTPTSARTAALFPAASVSASPSPGPS